MSLRIKREDMVVVISGRYKGMRGRVLAVTPKTGMAIVEGVKLAKHHTKAKSQTQPGGIIEREAPIDLSNLMLCEASAKGRAGRFSTREDDKGNKIRVLKLAGEGKEVTV